MVTEGFKELHLYRRRRFPPTDTRVLEADLNAHLRGKCQIYAITQRCRFFIRKRQALKAHIRTLDNDH